VIFALGMQDQVGGSTVGALFITLPTAFDHMGFAGTVIGIIFFVALVVGALTSAVSLLEVVVSSAMDVLGWSRIRATSILGGLIAIIGIPAALDIDFLGLMDKVAGNVLLVFGGLVLSIFVGWVMDDPIGEVEVGTDGVRWFGLWRVLLRYVVPALLGVVLWNSLGATWMAFVDYFAEP
jgi:NSS family neurotransmitter:Na+ symporter